MNNCLDERVTDRRRNVSNAENKILKRLDGKEGQDGSCAGTRNLLSEWQELKHHRLSSTSTDVREGELHTIPHARRVIYQNGQRRKQHPQSRRRSRYASLARRRNIG